MDDKVKKLERILKFLVKKYGKNPIPVELDEFEVYNELVEWVQENQMNLN